MIRPLAVQRMMAHELRLLLRSRWVRLAWLATMAAVAASLWLGWAAMAQRQMDVEQASALQSAQHGDYVRRHPQGLPGAGDVAYATFRAFPDAPGPLAWLSLGDRDTRPAVQRIRMLGLQAQMYDGEANNPEQSAAGTFDFGFAVVFLLPLLCICLCHDLATQDREQGRDKLLSSLVTSTRSYWLRRIAARYLLACAAVLLPFMLFCAAVGDWPPAMVLVIVAVALYSAVWTSLCAWISLRWRASSSMSNAMAMLTLWVATTMALPALSASLIVLWSPMPSGSDIALAHRKQLNDAWDLPKETTFQAFFRAHPEWRATPPVTGRFHWKWYYAFQHVADLHVEPMVKEAEAAMRARASLGDRVGALLPPVAMQRLMDGFADNGIERLIEQRAAIRVFHDRLRLHFYPFVFEERPYTAADFAAMPVPQAAPHRLRHSPLSWVGLILLFLLTLVALARQLSLWPRV